MLNNDDLLNTLREFEYLIREGVVFSSEEKSESIIICNQIINHFEGA